MYLQIEKGILHIAPSRLTLGHRMLGMIPVFLDDFMNTYLRNSSIFFGLLQAKVFMKCSVLRTFFSTGENSVPNFGFIYVVGRNVTGTWGHNTLGSKIYVISK